MLTISFWKVQSIFWQYFFQKKLDERFSIFWKNVDYRHDDYRRHDYRPPLSSSKRRSKRRSKRSFGFGVTLKSKSPLTHHHHHHHPKLLLLEMGSRSNSKTFLLRVYVVNTQALKRYGRVKLQEETLGRMGTYTFKCFFWSRLSKCFFP